MPELGLYGSVRGALSNERPYRDSMRVFRILTEPTSTPMRDEDADLVGRCEDHVGAVAHHARLDDGGRAFLRAVAADIGFEPQVPLPKIADLPSAVATL